MNTPTWQLSTFPRWPHHWRLTPTECVPRLGKLLGSKAMMPSGSPNRSATWLQSMEESLPPPLLQNRACHFRGTRLLSDVPSGRGIRLAVADSPDDLGSDVSRLPLAGHRSLAFPRGFSRFFALLLLITCPSPSSRQRILGIPPGLGFWRNPSPYALRLAPAP